jgi:hypothetical protein
MERRLDERVFFTAAEYNKPFLSAGLIAYHKQLEYFNNPTQY